MFDMIRGILKGTKVAKSAVGICKSIVNDLIQAGIHLKIEDTAYFLQECYFLLLFKDLEKKRSIKYSGALAVQAHDILMDWLRAAFESSDPEYDFSDVITDWGAGLGLHYNKWCEKMKNESPEMLGKRIDEWIPIAIDRVIDEIANSVFERGGSLPSEWSSELRASLTQRLSLP